MTTTARILAVSLTLAGCVPLHYADWPALPDGAVADAAVVADAAPADAHATRAEVVAVDVPGADVVVVDTGDSAVVWITDAPDASADAGVADAGAVDTGSAPDVPPACPALQDRCDGACVPLLTTAAHCGACGRACPSTATGVGVCNGGRCEVACREGYADCGRGCQATASDPQNCGACGFVCGTREACVAGNCAPVDADAPDGTTLYPCGGSCVDTSVDRQNCGGCDRQCAAGRTCRGGVCWE